LDASHTAEAQVIPNSDLQGLFGIDLGSEAK